MAMMCPLEAVKGLQEHERHELREAGRRKMSEFRELKAALTKAHAAAKLAQAASPRDLIGTSPRASDESSASASMQLDQCLQPLDQQQLSQPPQPQPQQLTPPPVATQANRLTHSNSNSLGLTAANSSGLVTPSSNSAVAAAAGAVACGHTTQHLMPHVAAQPCGLTHSNSGTLTGTAANSSGPLQTSSSSAVAAAVGAVACGHTTQQVMPAVAAQLSGLTHSNSGTLRPTAASRSGSGTLQPLQPSSSSAVAAAAEAVAAGAAAIAARAGAGVDADAAAYSGAPGPNPLPVAAAASQPQPQQQEPQQSQTQPQPQQSQQQQQEASVQPAADGGMQDPMVDILLQQVSSLMSEKQQLAARCCGLQRENEQLVELVGVLHDTLETHVDMQEQQQDHDQHQQQQQHLDGAEAGVPVPMLSRSNSSSSSQGFDAGAAAAAAADGDGDEVMGDLMALGGDGEAAVIVTASLPKLELPPTQDLPCQLVAPAGADGTLVEGPGGTAVGFGGTVLKVMPVAAAGVPPEQLFLAKQKQQRVAEWLENRGPGSNSSSSSTAEAWQQWQEQLSTTSSASGSSTVTIALAEQ